MSIPREIREQLLVEWSHLTDNKDKKIELGQKIFRRLFTVHSEFLKLFNRFEGVTNLDEIMNSPAMKSHCIRFVNSLSGVFETLDSPEQLGDMLKTVGSSHKLRKVTPDHFAATIPILEEVLLSVLLSESVKEAMKQILVIAAPIILQANGD